MQLLHLHRHQIYSTNRIHDLIFCSTNHIIIFFLEFVVHHPIQTTMIKYGSMHSDGWCTSWSMRWQNTRFCTYSQSFILGGWTWVGGLWSRSCKNLLIAGSRLDLYENKIDVIKIKKRWITYQHKKRACEQDLVCVLWGRDVVVSQKGEQLSMTSQKTRRWGCNCAWRRPRTMGKF